MRQLIGIFRNEFNMSIRRPGLWVAYLIVFGFFGATMFLPGAPSPNATPTGDLTLQEAGHAVYMFNMFLPLVAGILAADRMQRDFRLGLRELQGSTPVRNTTYILGKYFGVLFSLLLPLLGWLIIIGAIIVTSGQAPAAILGYILLGFLTISVPSFAFVTAFSLACPLFMPLRVYQILFTGYWFWGNYLSPSAFPTISDTLLNSSGIYALQGFFRGTISQSNDRLYTSLEAWLNIFILSACVALVFAALGRYFAWRTQKA